VLKIITADIGYVDIDDISEPPPRRNAQESSDKSDISDGIDQRDRLLNTFFGYYISISI
jgi:hypothetical protein